MYSRPSRLLASIVACLIFAGCGQTGKASPDLGWVREDPVIYVVPSGTPKFEVTDLRVKQVMAGAQVAGLVGVLVGLAIVKGMDTGDDLNRRLAPEEAMSRFRPRLLQTLGSDSHLAGVRWIDAGGTRSDRAAAPPQAAILTLKLDEWGIRSHKDDSEAFVPVVTIVAKLTRNDTVLWKAECTPADDSAGLPLPTLPELRSNNNERLHQLMERAVDACADDLAARFLGRSGPPRDSDKPEKRELRLTGKTLGDVEAIVLGTAGSPGLVAGPAPFDARFQDVALAQTDLEALQRVLREAMAGPGDSELRVNGSMAGRRFATRMERNRAGRARLKFEGLRFASEADVDAFLAAFAAPGIRRIEFEGEAGGRMVKRSQP
jgi:hypothetical protein